MRIFFNVRNDRAGHYIEDLCRKVGIELIEDEGVPVIDGLLGQFMDLMD